MEKQEFDIGDIVKVVFDNYNNDMRIGKVVSVSLSEKYPDDYLYGISFNIYGKIHERQLLSKNNNNRYELNSWVDSKVEIKSLE